MQTPTILPSIQKFNPAQINPQSKPKPANQAASTQSSQTANQSALLAKKSDTVTFSKEALQKFANAKDGFTNKTSGNGTQQPSSRISVTA